jgi:UDP-N-acetylglucosamine--N-acetylmuramyl-(pentapeptide) pyrophosphoryl-undecaprenol N-acetylglucosamine transferase
MGDGSTHKVLFAGGGTGGHLMPAINIALALKRIDATLEILFIGKIGGMEAAIVKKFGFEIKEIEVTGLKRNPAGLVKFILNWRKGFYQAKEIVSEFDPDVVVGTGGYVSAPIVRAAYKQGKPIFLQEQNSLPGLATRTLSKMANNIFTAYKGAEKYLPAELCRLVGNPVRPDLLEADKQSAYAEFGLDPAKRTLFVVGGSSGARGINNAMLTLANSESIPADWQLLWQIGQKDFSKLSSAIPGNFQGKYLSFIHNMPGAYAITDLIVSRSGAMTLAEIAAWGLPSILIPYPYATGDHQTINALEFTIKGAGIVIPETEIDRRLSITLEELFSNSEKRSQMASAARELAKPDAANIIAQTILDKVNEIQKN